MAKRMKFERKAMKAGWKGGHGPLSGAHPHLSSPPPEETLATAASGTPVNKGMSDKMPLSPEGTNQAAALGDAFAKKGGLDAMVTPPSVRTKQTSDAIKSKVGAIPDQAAPGLESWAQGGLEGQPEASVKGQIQDLIRKNPGTPIPGQGSMASQPGESFDQFKGRALPAIRGVMQQFAEGMAKNPEFKLGVTTHSQVGKLTRAWLAKGTPDDFSIHTPEMAKDGDAPGSVHRLFPNKSGDWELNPVDMKDPSPLEAGIYLIHHASTPQSAENSKLAEDQQRSLGEMSKHVASGDFGRARAFASKASKAGLPDDAISSYIDQALPDAKTAGDLPMPQLLATLAAAGPSKKAEYAPLVQSHFSNMQGLPPEHAQALQQHLASMGYSS